MLGVAREKILRLLVHFLLVFVQAFALPESVPWRVRCTLAGIERVSMFSDHHVKVHRTIVFHILLTADMRGVGGSGTSSYLGGGKFDELSEYAAGCPIAVFDAIEFPERSCGWIVLVK